MVLGDICGFVGALVHGLYSRGDRPEGALEGVGVGGAGRGRRESVGRAHALGQRRVGLVAAPLVGQHVGPAHRTEARRADRDGR